MNSVIRHQSRYFDYPRHRYPAEFLLHPPLAQQLEMQHLESFLPASISFPVLDFGCGSGRVAVYFLKKGFDVLGVDVSPDSLRDLNNFYKRHKTNSWGKLTLSASLPTRPAVSAIIGADVLHHVEIKNVLPQFRACLLPRGPLAFSEPNAFYPLWYLHYLLKQVPWNIEKGILQCTSVNFTRLFRRAGFSHVRIYPHGILPTGLFNYFPDLCRFNALFPAKLPILSPISFRLIATADKL